MRALALLLSSLLVVAGCASSKIDGGRDLTGDEKLPRPDRILVYDINANPADIAPTSALTGRYVATSAPLSSEEARLGREIGGLVSERLVANLRRMGLTVHRAQFGPAPRIGDVVISGHFVTVDQGDKDKRFLVGFGAGASELITHIEGYLVTEEGLRLLGYRQATDRGGKKPGVIVPTLGSFASRSPAGLIVGGAVNVEKYMNSETRDAAVERTADAIGDELKTIFAEMGWI